MTFLTTLRTAIVRHMSRPSLLGLPVGTAMGRGRGRLGRSKDATRILYGR